MWKWLEAAEYEKVVKDEIVLVAFEPSKYKVANVLEALKAIGHVAEQVQPPVWLEQDRTTPIIAKAAEDAVVALFPQDPPEYMERGPFSYADPGRIEHDLFAAGFTHVDLETVTLSSRVSARDAAEGMVLGSPFRAEIERRDPSALDRAVEAVAEALRPWDGKDAPISAHVVAATKP